MNDCTEHSEFVWNTLTSEVHELAKQETTLVSFYHSSILSHQRLSSALSYILANKLGNSIMPAISIRDIFKEAYIKNPCLVEAAALDMSAVFDRDPAIGQLSTVLLYLKGFQALQCHRLAHYLWENSRHALALYLQSQIAESFGVDIHPAAQIGTAVMLDHATGIVIGETAVVANNVSILQGVTLGGTGNECGDRHPKIAEGVMIGAGAKVLGNIVIGEGAKIGAGSVVVKAVAPHTTVAGIPAKPVGAPNSSMPALDMSQEL